MVLMKTNRNKSMRVNKVFDTLKEKKKNKTQIFGDTTSSTLEHHVTQYQKAKDLAMSRSFTRFSSHSPSNHPHCSTWHLYQNTHQIEIGSEIEKVFINEKICNWNRTRLRQTSAVCRAKTRVHWVCIRRWGCLVYARL